MCQKAFIPHPWWIGSHSDAIAACRQLFLLLARLSLHMSPICNYISSFFSWSLCPLRNSSNCHSWACFVTYTCYIWSTDAILRFSSKLQDIYNFSCTVFLSSSSFVRPGTAVERRSFPVLRSTYSWRVTTYVDKLSVIGQPTRPTQPFIPSGSIDE